MSSSLIKTHPASIHMAGLFVPGAPILITFISRPSVLFPILTTDAMLGFCAAMSFTNA